LLIVFSPLLVFIGLLLVAIGAGYALAAAIAIHQRVFEVYVALGDFVRVVIDAIWAKDATLSCYVK